METAWARHGMCELALTVTTVQHYVMCVGMKYGLLTTSSCLARHVPGPGKDKVLGEWSTLHNEGLCGYWGDEN
jgi:hypothetical protein